MTPITLKEEARRLLAGDRYLSVQAVAEYLGVPTRTIRYWAQQGLLQGVRLPNRKWRFHPAEVAAFVRRRRYERSLTSAPPPPAAPPP
jgi:excisionase family DNA binding protein